jgi:phosphate transport system substrate-binding protein
VLAKKTGTANKIAEDFIKFTASKAGQAVVAKGYIIIDPEAPEYKAASGLSGKITLSGSTSVEKVIERLKEEYVKLNPHVKVEINYNGSSAGIKDCLSNKSDIAMSSRELKAEEKAQLAGTTFALDGIAVIVNRANTINNMTSEIVTKIFKGEIRYWEDITVN